MFIITVQIFPCVSKFFPVSEQNSLCFPCLEKVRTKFPVFPVPWPPVLTYFSNPSLHQGFLKSSDFWAKLGFYHYLLPEHSKTNL